jgi:Lrp/AsnC family leucine-responsive transcriptional regulator
LKLDKKDYKILFELDGNARQTNTQIAKKVGLSKDSVAYRIGRLEKNKILTGYRTLINFQKLGYNAHRILIRFIDINPGLLKELVEFLKNSKDVWLFGRNEGEWDFAFVYLAKTIME